MLLWNQQSGSQADSQERHPSGSAHAKLHQQTSSRRAAETSSRRAAAPPSNKPPVNFSLSLCHYLCLCFSYVTYWKQKIRGFVFGDSSVRVQKKKKEAARIKRRGHRLPLPFAVARMRVERGKVRESAGKARENPDACRDLTATVPASHRASLNNTPRPAAAAEQWPAPETMQTDSWSSRLTSDSLYILYTLLYVLYIVYKLSTINVSVNAS